MHSTRTFVITVNNDRVSCHARTLNRNFAHAATGIVTRAHFCLTAAGHCYVMLGTIKFVDNSVNDNSARRLNHCDVIASRSGFGMPLSEDELQTEFKSLTDAHLGSNTNQHTDWGTFIKSSRSVYAPHLVQSVRLHLFKYRGDDNDHWISKNKMAATAVQWELCGANFRENIANLWVSCYHGNNDRSASLQYRCNQRIIHTTRLAFSSEYGTRKHQRM